MKKQQLKLSPLATFGERDALPTQEPMEGRVARGLNFSCCFFMPLLLALLLGCATSRAQKMGVEEVLRFQSGGRAVVVEKLAQNIGVIWGFDFLDQDRVIYTVRDGDMGILDLKKGTHTGIIGAPKVWARGQGGLLDVRLHPQFAKNKLIYLSYSKFSEKKDKATTALARATLDGARLRGLKDIFVSNAYSSTTRHFGSRLVFDKVGYLFLSIGDRGRRDRAQDLKLHHGKILRLNGDGTIPKDNPFQSAVWSYGHRNPQGMDYDRQTGRLWVQEHGPRGGDEINLIEKGKNYGWPVITYGKEYIGGSIGEGTSKKGMQQPNFYWVPSIAPSGLVVYRGDPFPEWDGHLFSGALKLQHLNRLELNPDLNGKKSEERLLKSLNDRIRNVDVGRDGFIYYSSDSGYLARLRPLPKQSSEN